MRVQGFAQHLGEQPRAQMQQTNDLGHRIGHPCHPRMLALGQAELLGQFRRVRHGESRSVHHQHPGGLTGLPRGRHQQLHHAPQEGLQRLQRQTGPSPAITPGGKVHTRQLSQMRDGGIAVENPQQKQPQGHQRPKQALAPEVAGLAAKLIQQGVEARISRQRVATKTRSFIE